MRLILACFALAFVGTGGVFVLSGRRGTDFFGVLAAVGIVVGAATVFVLWGWGVARLVLRAYRRVGASRRLPPDAPRERPAANDPHPPAAI